jgi:hypothetical protein
MAHWREHSVRMLDGARVQSNILTPRLRTVYEDATVLQRKILGF